jgi:hypothetical protein
MLIVLEARDVEAVEGRTSSTQRLVSALRDQLLIAAEGKPTNQRSDRWKIYLGSQNRTFTVALVSVLLVLSLTFCLGSALQIRQAEGSGGTISGALSGLFGSRRPESAGGSIAGGATPTPKSTLESYGAGFIWPDRFNIIEVRRETENSKVLWPLSTLLSALVLGAWLYPRPDR